LIRYSNISTYAILSIAFFITGVYWWQVPLVVRLEGTNVDNAKKILAEANLKIEAASDLDDAARKAVSMLRA
jgi:succinyl-CoA synthetase beta subunit